MPCPYLEERRADVCIRGQPGRRTQQQRQRPEELQRGALGGVRRVLLCAAAARLLQLVCVQSPSWVSMTVGSDANGGAASMGT